MGLALAGCGLAALAQNQQPVPSPFEKSAAASDSPADTDPFDPDVSAPKLVQVQVEYLELSHTALTKLLFLATPQSADATALRKQLQEMVATNDAKVLETQLLVAKSGQKATTESLHEFMYPTEYVPPMIPNAQTKEGEQKETGKIETIASAFCSGNATPSAFETRSLGSTLEIEPTIGESDTLIDLRFVPELVWHTGDTIWHEGKDVSGNPFKVSLPDIYTMRVNTSITCIKGQYMLVTVQSPKDAKGEPDMTRKVMVFVKCNILSVK